MKGFLAPAGSQETLLHIRHQFANKVNAEMKAQLLYPVCPRLMWIKQLFSFTEVTKEQS